MKNWVALMNATHNQDPAGVFTIAADSVAHLQELRGDNIDEN
jgi:hypothetical protein